MEIDFTNAEYLKNGTERQLQAYEVIKDLLLFDHLKPYDPILTGTIPIGIDLPESDLDIICCCSNHDEISQILNRFYSEMDEFEIGTQIVNGLESTIASFQYGGFLIEVFAQDCPTLKQNAYRHMIIEYQILSIRDNAFRAAVIKLKEQGYKTEPAFAKLLGLKGDPFEALLNYKI